MLWDKLHSISISGIGRWLVAGDLNDILGHHEDKGGPGVKMNKGRRFAIRMDGSWLCGSKFTWRGPIMKGVRRYRRLDSGLCNDEWRISFHDAWKSLW